MKRVISTLMAVAVLMSLVVVLGARADTGDPILLLEQLPDATGALLADSGLWNSGYCTNNPCSVADNVVVLEGEARTISQIQLWGIYSGLTHDPSAYVDDFTVIIHQDPSGMPGTAIYSEASVESSRVPTGVQLGTDPELLFPEYLITLTLSTPQSLGPGTYWVEIYNTGGIPTPDGSLPENAFGWELGDPDTLGFGTVGVALGQYVDGTATWVFYETYDLSLRLLGPAPTPPSAYNISPASAVAGSGDLTLTVNGSDFIEDSLVIWNDMELATTYVSSSELAATIPAESLASVQTAQVSVGTFGSTSNVLAFFVTEAAAEVTAQDAVSGTDPSASVETASATATGEGLLVVAEYDASPAGTPSFSVSGTYFDVYAAPDSSFSQVMITACGLGASDKLFWWNGTGWVKASPQSYSDGCVTFIVTDSSSPSLSQLQGTYFVAGLESSGNSAPVADPGGPYLGPINTDISFDGSLSSDPDGDALTYTWDLGDGNTSTEAMPAYPYSAAGVYNVCLTVNDGDLDSEPACTLAVVYDPSAGFVTGGGWIDSPAGAYIPDPDLSGKATFGFVSKYKKGASVPEGNTEFQFQAGGFNFHSTAYDWLVVEGKTKAHFKGSGTVNGALDPNGNAYKFMLWATDGTPDTFRIKIWHEEDGAEVVVYDNGFDQAIGGGSIVVHTK